ncbi:MAG: hypothetical protein IJU52_01565 [Clostridia bacterium]|nr:hypothetical protein [Clostridia bacterium]
MKRIPAKNEKERPGKAKTSARLAKKRKERYVNAGNRRGKQKFRRDLRKNEKNTFQTPDIMI